MLIEFSVENFLSINDRVTLSMVASKDKSHENNVIEYKDNKKELKALKTAVIYGANASGKSNVLKAMEFMSSFLKKSHEMQQGKRIGRIAFKLDRSNLKEPSKFDIIFRYKDIKYAYGFSVTEEEVVDEYLYYYPNGRQSVIFERWDTKEYKFTIDIERQNELVGKFHSKNKLYLSTASLWEYEKAKPPFKWICEKLNVIIDHSKLEGVTDNLISNNNKVKTLVKNFLKEADFDIEDLVVSEVPMKEEFKNHVLKLFGDDIKEKFDLEAVLQVDTVRTGVDENGNPIDVNFEFDEESEGTQKFFALIGPWIEVLLDGSVLVVDELDIRLHTLLVRYLVELFHNPKINIKNAQLIFTTHDVNILDLDMFRRDQIWFTEKKEDKSTDVYSLDDFGVRKDERVKNSYLQGKYGAIPFIKGGNLWE